MAAKTPCPRCQRVGLVRAERVIKGAHASRTFYCGGCHYSWIVDDDEQAPDAEAAAPPDGPG